MRRRSALRRGAGEGIRCMAQLLGEIAPRFERADVYAQLLRIRLYADWAGAVPLDREAARIEADPLAVFQAASSDRASTAATISDAGRPPGCRTSAPSPRLSRFRRWRYGSMPLGRRRSRIATC